MPLSHVPCSEWGRPFRRWEWPHPRSWCEVYAVLVIFLLWPVTARAETIYLPLVGVRYLGIDTPETYFGVECYGPEAKERNRELVGYQRGELLQLCFAPMSYPGRQKPSARGERGGDRVPQTGH